jgi:hypothetical protein
MFSIIQAVFPALLVDQVFVILKMNLSIYECPCIDITTNYT